MPLTLQTIRSRSAQLFSMYLLMLSYSSKEKLPGGLMHQCCSRIAWTKVGFQYVAYQEQICKAHCTECKSLTAAEHMTKRRK